MGRQNAISEETKQAVAIDYLAGMTQNKIADKHSISTGSVSRIVSEMKMSDLKEKEPAPAETETSPKENYINRYNDTTKTAESQALRGVEVIGLMQTMLIGIEESFGYNVDITSLRADSEQAHLMFRYGGTNYVLSFGLAF